MNTLKMAGVAVAVTLLAAVETPEVIDGVLAVGFLGYTEFLRGYVAIADRMPRLPWIHPVATVTEGSNLISPPPTFAPSLIAGQRVEHDVAPIYTTNKNPEENSEAKSRQRIAL